MRRDTARGQRIDALIRQSGKEPKQLAALWDCSESRISAVRKGAPFSLDLLLAMIHTLGWSADYILIGTQPNASQTKAGALTLTPADVSDIQLMQPLTRKQRGAVRGLLHAMQDQSVK